MTVKVNSEGDFAENTISADDSPQTANALADLYDVLIKGDIDESDFSIVTLAHEARKAFGDATDSESDVSQWCKIGDRYDSPSELRLIEKTEDMDAEPNLGRYFWKAVGFSANDYQSFDGKYESDVDIQHLGDVNEEGEVMLNYLIEKDVVSSDDTVPVPVNSEGEIIPPFVVSNERQEGAGVEFDLPTYEEGIERLQVLLSDHFGDEIEEQSAANESDESESDNEEDDHFLSDVNKVGPATAANIKDYLVENRESIDWRNHIDAEEWLEAPTIVTEGEAMDRVNDIADQLSDSMFELIMQKIESDNIDEAVTMIENFE